VEKLGKGLWKSAVFFTGFANNPFRGKKSPPCVKGGFGAVIIEGLFLEIATGTVAVPDKIIGLTLILDFIDRGHSLCSLYLPQAAVASLPLNDNKAWRCSPGDCHDTYESHNGYKD
jgi:hypothetical protein